MKNMKEAGGSEAFKSILSTTNFERIEKCKIWCFWSPNLIFTLMLLDFGL